MLANNDADTSQLLKKCFINNFRGRVIGRYDSEQQLPETYAVPNKHAFAPTATNNPVVYKQWLSGLR